MKQKKNEEQIAQQCWRMTARGRLMTRCCDNWRGCSIRLAGVCRKVGDFGRYWWMVRGNKKPDDIAANSVSI